RFGRPLHYRGPSLELGPEAPSAPPLAVAPSGQEFAVDTTSNGVGLFSVGALTPRRTVSIAGGATALAWSPRGVLGLGGQNGKVELVAGATTRSLAGLAPRPGTSEAIEAIAFGHRGELVAAAAEAYRG